MAKKSTVHNHIDNVTVNIDYDQLAKAIEKEQKKDKCKKRMGTRQLLMTLCNSVSYAALYSYVICEVIKMWQKYVSVREPGLYTCIVYTVTGVSLAILLFLAHLEAVNDSKEDVIAQFNINISLIALMAALIALVKR